MKLRWRWPNRLDVASIGCYFGACGIMSHYNVPVLAGLVVMLLVVFGSVLAQDGNRA